VCGPEIGDYGVNGGDLRSENDGEERKKSSGAGVAERPGTRRVDRGARSSTRSVLLKRTDARGEPTGLA
jgi:hypothetical protein